MVRIDGSKPVMRKFAASSTAASTIFATLSLAAAAFATPAIAQVYKWIDEAGTTHYSDQAPQKRDSARKVAVVSDRVSFYEPAPLPVSNAGRDTVLNAKVEALERQLQAERRARDSVAAAEAQAALAAYQRCLAERRVDCDGYAGYPQYAVPLVFAPVRRFRQPVAFTGFTPGNAVPIMPGNFNGPTAITAGNFTTSRPNAAGRGAALMPR